MNIPLPLRLALLIGVGACLRAATPLVSGHADVGIGYEGAFDLHVHDEETDTEYPPADALLVVGSQGLQFSTGGNYSFLGPAGTPVWVLPQNESENLLFLGLGTEELVPAEWNGNITLSLSAVSGPGSFYQWRVDGFGNPVVFMNSADGITAADRIELVPGSHAHVNWGFSAPGTYSVSFAATGLNVADGLQNSGPVAFQFAVVPEPGLLALGTLGLGVLAWYGKRRAT